MIIKLLEKQILSESEYANIGKIESYDDFNINNVVLSRSSLDNIDPYKGGSPAKFRYRYLNKEDKETKSSAFGTKLHKYLESPDTFCPFEADKPTGKLGEIAENLCNFIENNKIITYDDSFETIAFQKIRSFGWNNRWSEETIKKNKDYLSFLYYLHEYINFLNSGKIPMTAYEKKTMEGIINSLENYKYIKELVYGESKKEVAYLGHFVAIIDNKEYPFKFKGLIDSEFPERIIDYKSTKESITNFEGEIKRYNLDRQLGYYSLFYEQPIKKSLIVFETSEPYEIALIDIQRRTNEKQLIRMALRCFYNIDGNTFDRIHTEYNRDFVEYDTNYMIFKDNDR